MNVEGSYNHFLDNEKHCEPINRVLWHHMPEEWIPFSCEVLAHILWQGVGTYPVVRCWHMPCGEVLVHVL